MELNFLTIGIAAAFVMLYFFYQMKRHDFRKWGIPQIDEVPILGIVGNGMIRRQHITKVLSDAYNLNKDAKYTGLHVLMTPLVIVRDLDLIKTVLVKDFDHFTDHPTFSADDDVEPLFGKSLFQLPGEKWKRVRHMLSPSFTAIKMKAMFPLMAKVAENFTTSVVELSKDKEEIDIKDTLSKYTNDVIATCAFGIEVDSMKDPTNEFYLHGKAFNKTSNFESFLLVIKVNFMATFPLMTKFLGFRMFPKQLTNFFVNVVKDTVKTRDEKGIERPDMMQLMMNAREKTDQNMNLDVAGMAAQAFIFFATGFEITSFHLSITAYELAVNPKVQEKLQAEIDAIYEKNNGKIDYDALSHMPYFDAVFLEVLRLHPQAPFLNRACTKRYELPPTLPGSKPYQLEVGDQLFIPVSAIQRDPLYYEEPDKFDPERYMGTKVTTVDPINLGFGMGPRMCIGNKFAILDCKVLLFHLLRKCSFQPCAKTGIPFRTSLWKIAPVPVNGFWLNIKER